MATADTHTQQQPDRHTHARIRTHAHTHTHLPLLRGLLQLHQLHVALSGPLVLLRRARLIGAPLEL